MKADNLISQLSKQSTVLKGCFIKKLPLRGYFEVLKLLRIDNELQSRFKELMKQYKILPKDKFSIYFREISRHIKEVRLEIFGQTLICENKHLKYLEKLMSKNYKTIFKSLENGSPFVFKKKLTAAKLNVFYRVAARFKYLLYDSLPDMLFRQSYAFNYAYMLKQKNEVSPEMQTDNIIKDAYLAILASLEGSFSKEDIDSLTIEQATELASLVRMEKAKLYYTTHFQGIRYHAISQSSFKNDNSGSKRQKVLNDIHSELIKLMKPKSDKPEKSRFIQAMEREALEVLKAKAEKAGSKQS